MSIQSKDRASAEGRDPSPSEVRPWKDATVLIVGAGGLGCPAAQILAKSGIGRLIILDDDVVDRSNLQRQILFSEQDIGRWKADVAVEKLAGLGALVEGRRARLLPETALELATEVDLIIEGTDNLPSKFLACDAANLTGTPVVHAGALRWGGWAFASKPSSSAHAPCLRCLFEDLPAGPTENCEFAGVVGPVVGALGAIEALLALQLLNCKPVGGVLVSLDGLSGRLRKTKIDARPDCPSQLGHVSTLRRSQYIDGLS